jgi:hypothetical protein
MSPAWQPPGQSNERENPKPIGISKMPLIRKAERSCKSLYEQEEPLYEKQGTHPKHKPNKLASRQVGLARRVMNE